MIWLLMLLFAVGFAVCLWVLLFPGEKDTRSKKERVAAVSNKHSPSMTAVEAARERIAARRRAALLEELEKEQALMVQTARNERLMDGEEWEREHQPARLERSEEAAIAEHHSVLATHALNLRLLDAAGKENLDVATYLELKKKAELDRLDLTKQWQEAEQQLKAGFIYQLQAHQHLALMTEYIGKLYDRAEELQTNGKTREHSLIEEHIRFMEEDFRGRQRLLQASNGEEVSGSNEIADASGDGGQAVEAEQLAVPVTRGRGRPKGSPNKRGRES